VISESSGSEQVLRFRLAQMPSGDAFRADVVRAIRVVPDETLLASPVLLFAVMVELDGGDVHCVASGLEAREARRIASATTKEVNACLAAPA